MSNMLKQLRVAITHPKLHSSRIRLLATFDVLEGRIQLNSSPPVIFKVTTSLQEYAWTSRVPTQKSEITQLKDSISYSDFITVRQNSPATGTLVGSSLVKISADAGILKIEQKQNLNYAHKGGWPLLISELSSGLSVEAYVLGGPGTPYTIDVTASDSSKSEYVNIIQLTTGYSNPGWLFRWNSGRNSFSLSSQSEKTSVIYNNRTYTRVIPFISSGVRSYFADTGPTKLAYSASSNLTNIMEVEVENLAVRSDIIMIDAKFAGSTSEVNYLYSTVGDPGVFSASLYRSADQKFDTGDVLLSNQVVTPKSSNSVNASYFKFSTPLVADPSRPYLIVVADPSDSITEIDEDNNLTSLVLPTVSITLKPSPLLTLMENAVFTIDVTPKSLTGIYELQYKKVVAPNFISIPANSVTRVTQRLAGIFVARGSITIDGIRFASNLINYAVQFPSYDDITRNPTVLGAMRAAWARTLAATTPFSRREEGFWIQINTATGNYNLSNSFIQKKPSTPSYTASVVPSKYPPDSIGGSSAIYTVGIFHTHTPMTFRTGTREVGPSYPRFGIPSNPPNEDLSYFYHYDVVGIVYDYIANSPIGPLGSIKGGSALNSPARLYHGGPFRRTTPKT